MKGRGIHMSKIVLITGASSGYGRATAKAFAEKGYTVVIAARNRERLEEAKAETGADALFVMDVTRPEDWRSIREFITGKYGRLDILVNNAGGGVAIREVRKLSVEEIDSTIRLNLNSVIYGCREFAPVFKAQKGGTIINVSSVCAKKAWQGWSIYAAAKWGVLGFTKGLTTELGTYGVRVTCLIPGAGDTNFDKNAGFYDRGSVPALKAENIAEAIGSIYKLPDHVWVEEMTVWGLDQVVIPL